jgi:hypothetical protein
MDTAPGQGKPHDHQLQQEHVPVPGLPEVGELGQPDDREVCAGKHEYADHRDRQAREPDERTPPELRRRRPDDQGERRHAAHPHTRREQVDPVGQLGE